MSALKLRSGDLMPKVGFGTWKCTKDTVAELVYQAICKGYRHLDCACDYGNEKEVGDGINRAIKEGVVTRKELFVTTKLWNTFHEADKVEIGCRKSLKDLQLGYVDLYLIHFPISLKFVPIETRYPPEWIYDPECKEPKMELINVPYAETWKAMEALHDKKLVRNIGVANLCAFGIMDLLSYARIPPAVNQIEIHPYLTQKSLVDFCQSRGIVVTGFSSLGSSSYIQLNMDQGQGVGVLKEPLILELAKKYKKTPAQIALQWSVQRDIIVIPKTSKVERMTENLTYGFELSKEDMEAIMGLNRNLRYNDPGVFCVGMGGAVPIHD